MVTVDVRYVSGVLRFPSPNKPEIMWRVVLNNYNPSFYV